MPEQFNILFHGIGTPRRDLEPGEDQYWITEDAFHAILDEVAAWPAVSLSFDDSNSSDIEIALPALLDRGLTAEFFVLAGRLDQPGSLGEADLRDLLKQGMAVGTHGMHHHPWRGLTADTTRSELADARDRISAVIGRPVTRAACPLGRYDRGTLGALRRLGYTTVFTSDRRPARPGRWLQPRFSVYRDDTPSTVRAATQGSRRLPVRLRNAAAGVVKRWR
ncbi:glycosyl transferase family 2 [Actinoplanes sp. SE50]|uniref:polysaccharide deacetylase family protein n=1 Tax=unclassified Actinoplanes TaxID=2626549 RepID=UPI00023EBD24|nr:MULTISPECIES: polysaccharide deacetylase family protein [unclassified Actinoplanes]AEV84001.1 polysaccharide deacetylase [Actinoplanes sp. SE50/110]ATO82394.1 glycosyl transferase family 2 [Actinoplanes sp. SE50]SLL99801.1 glycosyl transferase family 2 [Actinoplanes sp. SE50/110]